MSLSNNSTNLKTEKSHSSNLNQKNLGDIPSLKPVRSEKTTKRQIIYDIFMLIVIVIDLTVIGFDLLLMSKFIDQIAQWLNLSEYLNHYTQNIHHPLRIVGGFFTIFLIVELSIRWILSILRKEYLRWFFFPFIHWYEVLGCFPQLRALRLLRAFIIGRKLYKMGYQVLPEKWIETGSFYYKLILEELSDRVILTATDNIRQQLSGSYSSQRLLNETLDKNRPELKSMLTSMLQQELTPQLKNLAHGKATQELSIQVGAAVHEALANTPELRQYLRMIPIAGKLIENQLQTIGQHVGENIVNSLSQRLTQTETIELLIDTISETITHIDLNNPEFNTLLSSIIEDSLTAFEQQVKVQQWKHRDYLEL